VLTCGGSYTSKPDCALRRRLVRLEPAADPILRGSAHEAVRHGNYRYLACKHTREDRNPLAYPRVTCVCVFARSHERIAAPVRLGALSRATNWVAQFSCSRRDI